MLTSQAAESFRDLLLRYRGRSSLTQRQLADRVGVHRRSVQQWEVGANYPSAERLEAIIQALLDARGLTPGYEAVEAQALWAAALREAPRMHAALDQVWLNRLVAERPTPAGVPAGAPRGSAAERGGRAGEQNIVECRQDWGEAPDTLGFVGRSEELHMLRTWVLDARCRLVAVLGMGGIGKTSVGAKLAQEVAVSFERVYWRSLRDAPPTSDWLSGAVRFLSDQQVVPPESESERIAALLQLLRDRRCLLVLDNVETVFEPFQHEGQYRAGLAGYGRLLEAMGEAMHQSCLLLTSREAPPGLNVLRGGVVQSLTLGGLRLDEAQALLASKQLEGSPREWAELLAHFGGNGLALKVVGERIREVFGGEIGSFLAESGISGVFGGIRRLLDEQVRRSSAPEQQLLRVLAVEREPVRLAALLAALGPRTGRSSVLEAVEALRRRSLLERAETVAAAAFTLQSVVLEYVTDRLVEDVSDEIRRGQPALLVEEPLIKAQAKDYVRQSQERLIGAPILQRLSTADGDGGTEQRLLALLERWRDRPASEQGHGPGKVVNLLRLLRGHVRGLDLSRLAIRQAYLAEVEAQDTSLADAHLGEAVLADVFSLPVSVAFSGDGALLAVGTSTGQVWLWRVADRTLVARLEGHTGVVLAVALAADGQVLATGSADGTARLWDANSGRSVATLQGHTGGVWGVALSANGELAASASEDGAVRLWEVRTGRLLKALHGHAGGVWSVALSADAQLLASGSSDGTVRLWEVGTRRLLNTLHGHIGGVWGVALSADGQLLASGGADATVRVWDASTGRLLNVLHGHTSMVRGVALSANAHQLVSSGEDGAVRLWEVSTGRPIAILHGHTSAVWGMALAADGQLAASASADGTVRLWDVSTGRPLATLQGHTSAVWGVTLSAAGQLAASASEVGTVRLWEASSGRLLESLEGHTGGVWGVALAAEGQLLAGGGGDGAVRLWEARSGRLLATLQAHAGGVWGVALAAEGQLLASGGADGTVRLWDASTGQPLKTLHGHTSAVWGVALTADGQLAASGGAEGALRLWETSTGRPMATLQGHTGGVRSVALSADGKLAASASEDGTVRLCDVGTGRLLASLQGHTGAVSGAALSANGHLLASGGFDGTVRLWETSTGRPMATLRGHAGPVRGVALSAEGHLVASGGFDGTVRLWAASSGSALRALRCDRRYERLNITGLTGITDAQRTALLALGAIECPGTTEAGP
jgi:WD40 repeat protein/transcriptional regulator with XRE-family HTH domain